MTVPTDASSKAMEDRKSVLARSDLMVRLCMVWEKVNWEAVNESTINTLNTLPFTLEGARQWNPTPIHPKLQRVSGYLRRMKSLAQSNVSAFQESRS